ncbi:MAG: helix-turn-helix domain-containing protein [Treponema sp.]|nr:helix-turn-helix domain-containing protein [Treponema sp.]
MKNKLDVSWSSKQTDPLLLKGYNILNAYAKATGSQICITDNNHAYIPEIYNDIITVKNTCLLCIKCRSNITFNTSRDFDYHPCRELHMEGLKKAFISGRTFNYTCDLGFAFWTSPLYSGRNFIGSFISSGFLCIDKKEAVQKMEYICNNPADKQELISRLSYFPFANPHQIRALSELMQVCAESLTHDKNDLNETLKRRGEQQKELTIIVDNLKDKFNNCSAKQNPGKTEENREFPEYPLEKEKEFLNAVRSGDIRKGSKLLNELLGIIIFISAEQFENIRFRILELAILLSRTDNLNSSFPYAYSNTAHQFLKSIEKAVDPQELIDAIHLMTQYMAGEAFSFQGIRHVSVLKKADRFIHSNFTRKISLNEIAAASGLSAPYFSTIFKEEMGENVSSYLNRLRVEKSCGMLAETHQSLSEIAYACGFKDQSWFSKIFRSYIGMNPAKYRQSRKMNQADTDSRMSGDYKSLINNH